MIEVNEEEEEEEVTEFERIRARARGVNERMKEGVQAGKPRKKPSKSLCSFMAAEKEVKEKEKEEDDEVCEVISDDNDKEESPPLHPPIKDLARSSTSSSTSSPLPSLSTRSTSSPLASLSTRPTSSTTSSPLLNTSSRKRSLTKAIAKKIEEEEEGAGGQGRGKRPLETPAGKRRRRPVVEAEESKLTFADFGGNDEVVAAVCRLLVHLKQPAVYLRLGVAPPCGFLLHGPPGTGKTLLAHAIAGELGLPMVKVAAPELVSGVSGDSESRIREVFQQARAAAPTVLFIDEIDCITGRREAAGKQMEGRMVAQLLASLDDLARDAEAQVMVIGATNRLETLDPALRRAGRFDREIALGIPDRAARERILEVVTRGLRPSPATSLPALAMLTPGYVGADLTSLAREAAMAAVNRVLGGRMAGGEGELPTLLAWLRGEVEGLGEEEMEGLFIQEEDWREALGVVQPSAKREGFATVPGVTWGEVGALGRVREELQLSILAPVTHARQFASLGLPSSSGVLLVGPPGCGKTLVAKAIANEAGINFISVKGPELLNMYVGESERAVRGVFQRAKNSAPCVIFFDEVDSLVPRRSAGGSDGASRVVNQLLTELDGVEGRAGVWVLAATNRPDILDPAVLRPGRLDKTLYVGFPGPAGRVEVLEAITRGGTRPTLGPGVTLAALGLDPRCEGFSGADMSNLVREASMAALREVIRRAAVGGEVVVEGRHFEAAFATVRPSVGARDRARYELLRVKYGHSVQADSLDATEEGRVDEMELSKVDILEEGRVGDDAVTDATEKNIGEESGIFNITKGSTEYEFSSNSGEKERTDTDYEEAKENGSKINPSSVEAMETMMEEETNAEDAEALDAGSLGLALGRLGGEQRAKVEEMVRHREPKLRGTNLDVSQLGLESLKPSTLTALKAFVTQNLRKKPRKRKAKRSDGTAELAAEKDLQKPAIEEIDEAMVEEETVEDTDKEEVAEETTKDAASEEGGVRLRFLPNMVIRVKDNSTVGWWTSGGGAGDGCGDGEVLW